MAQATDPQDRPPERALSVSSGALGSAAQPWRAAYLIAGAATAAAVLGRRLLDPWLADHLPFPTLFGAVAVSVWFGGYRPALLATAVGYLACAWLFVQPRGVLVFERASSLLGLGAYVVSWARRSKP